MSRKLSRLAATYQAEGLGGAARLVGRSMARRLQPAPAPAPPPAATPPVIDISDEYIAWLCFANAGMLNRGNLYCFDYALSHLPSQAPVLEIGSFCGLSTNALGYYKRRHGVTNRLLTCDRWEFEGAQSTPLISGSHLKRDEYRAFVRDSYLRNVGFFSRDDLPFTLEMFSDEFFSAWAAGTSGTDVFGRTVELGGPLSFAYIDGNHQYDYARRDFEHCDRWLVPGGFILFDDSADASDWEVRRVVAEVIQSTRYEVVAQNPNYLFRKTASG